MAIQSIKDMMESAAAGGYAVGFFESWNLESLQGVIAAAEETRSPVIIGFNGGFLSDDSRNEEERLCWYAALGRAAAESATVPCGLILNECSRDDWTKKALELGFNLVMPVDPVGDYERYVARAKEIVGCARKYGSSVEVELGELPCGLSSKAENRHSKTDPVLAARLVKETGANLLAVSVGNVHMDVQGCGCNGLDLELLASIRAKVSVPLVLHGGTGISGASIKAAIERGVAKINYGTYIKQRYLKALREAVNSDREDPHCLLGSGREEDLMVIGRRAVRDAVLERIVQLGCCGRA